MARKLRIAAICTSVATAVLILVVGGAYYAARQVNPFYEQALRLEPEVAQRGSRELESRATALYSDARQAGQWHALFTAEQINGWLAVQLDENQCSDENQESGEKQEGGDKQEGSVPSNIRDPRVAIAPGVLTLGFRALSHGMDTVVSVDAAVFLMEEGSVGIRFLSVRAGSLPLPVMQLADELATACQELKLPVRWTQQDGQPVAIVEIHSDKSSDRHFFVDSIELGEGELYVAGHTEVGNATSRPSPKVAGASKSIDAEIALDDYELRLTPRNRRSALEVARRSTRPRTKNAATSGR